MAQSGSERMARYRNRQRAAGMINLSLVVPAAEAQLFVKIAAERREAAMNGATGGGKRVQSWASMLSRPTASEPNRIPVVKARSHPPSSVVSRAEAVADKILKHVIDLGWPVGWALGSEPDLMKRYGVSRSVLRQTVRLLEHQSIARMRRGPEGSLIVAEPNSDAIERAVGVYLEYKNIKPFDILETRKVLELATTELTIRHLDARGEEIIRRILDAESTLDESATSEDTQRFHFALGELCADPALRLFGSIVLQLTDAHSTFRQRSAKEWLAAIEAIKKSHREIGNAILARDSARASRRMGRYIDGIRAWME